MTDKEQLKKIVTGRIIYKDNECTIFDAVDNHSGVHGIVVHHFYGLNFKSVKVYGFNGNKIELYNKDSFNGLTQIASNALATTPKYRSGVNKVSVVDLLSRAGTESNISNY